MFKDANDFSSADSYSDPLVSSVAPDETDITDKTISLSNGDFMTAIFGDSRDSCKPMVASVGGKLDAASFKKHGKGAPWDQQEAQYPESHNNYFSLSSYLPDDFGNYHRQKKHFGALHCVMLDDIGTKIPAEEITLSPTWKIETSAGNYQYGYIFAEPLTDVALVDILGKAITAKDLTDKGAGGFAARLARLPVAQNTKRDEPFICRLTHWQPELKYSVDELITAFNLELNTPKKKKSAKRPSYTKTAQSSTHIPKPDKNPVIGALEARNLYKSELSKGKHDITCPWVEEHTDKTDGGTAYFEPNENFPVGGFKCLHSHGNEKNISDLLEFLMLDFSAAKMKPIIRTIAGELHHVADSAEYEIAQVKRYYQRGGLIVTVVKEPSTKEIFIKPITAPALTTALSKYIAWEGYDGRAGGFVPKDPPIRIVSVIFDAEKYNHLPILNGIAQQPYLRDDHSLMCQRGYDEQSHIYGEFNPKDFHISTAPSKQEAAQALEKLEGLLDDFGFASETDRAAALAAILTAAIRPSLKLAPMFHVLAPMIGSGKSFLCQLISLFATARVGAPVAFPSEEEECRKLLLSEFLRAPAVIEFDNLTTDLKAHKSLCTALTSENMSDRILGVSKTATVSTRTLMLSSGNNVRPVNDMVRRTISINLDTGCEQPFARTYKNPHLLQDIREKRSEYVSAALTVIMAWLSASEPKPNCKEFATYNDWSNLCRYPLIWLGSDDPVKSVFNSLNDDPETETLQALLREWWAAFADTPLMIRQALDPCINVSNALNEIFYDIAGERDQINRKRLGHYIKRHQNRIIDGLKFVKAAGNFSAAAWQVKSVSSDLSVSSVASEEFSSEEYDERVF